MWRSYTSDHSNLLSSTFTYTIYSSTSELKFSKKWFSWPTKFLSKMEMTSHLFAQESLLQYLVLPSFPTKSRISLIWILFWRWRFHYRESKRDARTVEVETKVATKEGDWPTFYLAYRVRFIGSFVSSEFLWKDQEFKIVEEVWPPLKMKNKVGLTSSTILNSCSFRRYRCSFIGCSFKSV